MPISIPIVTRKTDDCEVVPCRKTILKGPEHFLSKTPRSVSLYCVPVSPGRYDNEPRKADFILRKGKRHSLAGYSLACLEDSVNLLPGSQSLLFSKASFHLRRTASSCLLPVACSARADHPWFSCGLESRTFGSSCACWVDRSASYISLL